MNTERVDEDHQDGADGDGCKHAMIVVLLGRHDVAADDEDQEKGPERLCDEPGDVAMRKRQIRNTSGGEQCA